MSLRPPSRRAPALVAVLLLAAALLAACDEPEASPAPATPSPSVGAPGVPLDATATATAEATPDATRTPRAEPPSLPAGQPLIEHPSEPSRRVGDGWIAGATGPLVVFVQRVGPSAEEREREGTFATTIEVGGNTLSIETLEVVTYDLGARQIAATFEVRAAPEPQVQLAGGRIFVRYQDALVVHELDGSGARVLRLGEGAIEGGVASPDGTLYALNEYPGQSFAHHERDQGTNRVVVLDVNTGEEVLTIAQPEFAAAGLSGQASPGGWTPDGQVLVVGLTYSHGGHPPALLDLDDGITMLESWEHGYAQASDRPVVRTSFGWSECALGAWAGVRRVELLDHKSGRVLGRLDAASPVLQPYYFSPDGTELLVARVEVTAEQAEALGGYADREECVPFDVAEPLQEQPRTWLLMRAGSAGPLEVASPLEAHERWLGERAVSYACRDAEVAGWGAGYPSGAPVGGPLGLPGECYDERIEVRVGGVAIASGDHTTVVLGFVDAPDAE